MENNIFLGLGTNKGNLKQNLHTALKLLKQYKIKIVKKSSVYKTQPWGYKTQPWFLNQVIKIKTNYSPTKLLQICKKIEIQMGRVRKAKWHSRIIDLDILLYNDKNVNRKNLIIPHPQLAYRKFVLRPLVEIVKNNTFKKILKICPDKSTVRKLPK